MTFENVVRALIAKFGDGNIVRTKDAMEHIESLGLDTQMYYISLRETFGVGHGKLCFSESYFNNNSVDNTQQVQQQVIESDQEIEQRITDRFEALDIMALATAKGVNRSLIISGPAGLGKSYGVEQAAEAVVGKDKFSHIKGYIRATGLYKTLWKNRNPGKLVVLDDADFVFADETTLMILKAACDSSKTRKISWLSQAEMEDEEGEPIPTTFEFHGSVIFITNTDLIAGIDRQNKLSPHYEALVSRSHYLDLSIKNKRDYIIRIKQVLRSGMLSDELTVEQKDEIVAFMEENMNKMRELSLRMVLKLADLYMMNNSKWKKLASMTCMK